MTFRTTASIRDAFLHYFEQQGHKVVPSASIVPIADDTLLFTNAGMVPFKQYFLNPKQAPFDCAVSAQRCLRVGGKHNDLDNVGYTARHHTFFEMLGNFSFGAYAKVRAIKHAMTFLTDVLALDINRFWVTVYQEDEETEALWVNEFGFPKERLVRAGAKDNFWSMGDTGPCGPCTEIFYDHGDGVAGGPPGSAQEDGDRYVEIWNIVFMQYDRQADGSLLPLDRLCVDTGMGLERISAVMQSVTNNYDTDTFERLIQAVQALSADKNAISTTSARVIADHMRSITWMMAEGILPANEGRGYVLRRIIRRALRYAYKSGLSLPCLYKLVDAVVHEYKHEQMLIEKAATIQLQLQQEEHAFALTISQGLQLFDKLAAAASGALAGEDVFKLYDTFGFPYDLVEDLAREQSLSVDKEGFDKAMAEQRARSRQHNAFQMQVSQDWAKDFTSQFCGYDGLSAEGKLLHIQCDDVSKQAVALGSQAALVLDNTSFYAESGGQVGDQGVLRTPTGLFSVTDTQRVHGAIVHWGEVIEGDVQVGQTVVAEVSERRYKTACNHSATHLLHAALRQELGEHVVQKGSLVTPERLRFDFAHHASLTSEQIVRIETIVNAHIAQSHPVVAQIMPFSEAKAQGVMALFTDKYQDEVRVLTMSGFSQELCGGIHVTNTAHIGLFVVIEETSVAQGVRRIEAYTGEMALAYYQSTREQLSRFASRLKVPVDGLDDKLQSLQEQLSKQAKLLQLQSDKLLLTQVPQLLAQRAKLEQGGLLVVAVTVDEQKQLRTLMDALVAKQPDAVIVLLSWFAPDKAIIAIGLGQGVASCYSASSLLRGLPEDLGVRGGGKPGFAQGSFSCEQQAVSAIREKIQAVITQGMKV